MGGESDEKVCAGQAVGVPLLTSVVIPLFVISVPAPHGLVHVRQFLVLLHVGSPEVERGRGRSVGGWGGEEALEETRGGTPDHKIHQY